MTGGMDEAQEAVQNQQLHQLRDELIKIYEEYSPSRLDNVEVILAEWKGNSDRNATEEVEEIRDHYRVRKAKKAKKAEKAEKAEKAKKGRAKKAGIDKHIQAFNDLELDYTPFDRLPSPTALPPAPEEENPSATEKTSGSFRLGVDIGTVRSKVATTISVSGGSDGTPKDPEAPR